MIIFQILKFSFFGFPSQGGFIIDYALLSLVHNDPHTQVKTQYIFSINLILTTESSMAGFSKQIIVIVWIERMYLRMPGGALLNLKDSYYN